MLRVKAVLNCLFTYLFAMAAGGPGHFDSVDGTYDEQTGFGFEKTRYYQLLTRTFIGSLSRGKAQTAEMTAGADMTVDGSAALQRKKISEGDMVRFTLTETIKGLPTFGDQAVARGDFMAYQNMESRVNQIDSPAIPVQGRMARQRAKMSLTDIPGDVENALINWCAEEVEFQALTALIAGASPSVLKGVSSGGLGDILGVKSLGTAGAPLMGRHWFTPQGGYLTFSTTPATWNATVNDAINAITDGAGGYVTLAQIKKIRRKLDTLGFIPVRLGGKTYKAVCLCDPDLWWRIDHLLATNYTYAAPRSDDNKVFGVDHKLEYEGILFLNVPNLEKFRVTYESILAVPSWGVGSSSDVYATDPRGYSTSSENALMIFLGGGGLLEGFNDSVSITTATADHGKGLEYAAHFDDGFKRGDWYAQDGRTGVTAALSYGCFTACFNEPGVGTGY